LIASGALLIQYFTRSLSSRRLWSIWVMSA